MQKVNDNPLIYLREDGTYVRFLVYHHDEGRHEVQEVTGTLEYCLGYYAGYSQTAADISAVDDLTFNEFASLGWSPTHECDNCGGKWEDGDLHEIRDYFQRVEPGGTVPSGECPKCNCLCYPTIGVGRHGCARQVAKP